MEQDRWAQWLLRRRDGGDADVRARAALAFAAYRDAVLDGGAIADGDVLLDVGAGDGLVGFAALDRVGATGQVIFSDVSTDLLDECRRRAEQAGVLARCRFVQASAEELRGIDSGSVDVVTTRSVLIYVADKDAAFAEFLRVLRPGGRLSIFEPINSFAVGHADGGLFGWDATPIAGLVAKLRRVFESVPRQRNPLLNFDERDLLRQARDAGFTSLTVEYKAELDVPEALPSTDWDVLKKIAPNPLAPTYEEALAEALTEAERKAFEDHVRAMLAAGTPARRTIATAYLRAVRP